MNARFYNRFIADKESKLIRYYVLSYCFTSIINISCQLIKYNYFNKQISYDSLFSTSFLAALFIMPMFWLVWVLRDLLRFNPTDIDCLLAMYFGMLLSYSFFSFVKF